MGKFLRFLGFAKCFQEVWQNASTVQESSDFTILEVKQGAKIIVTKSLLLMEGIRLTSWGWWLIPMLSHYLRVFYIPGGAGFLPSTVVSPLAPQFVCWDQAPSIQSHIHVSVWWHLFWKKTENPYIIFKSHQFEVLNQPKVLLHLHNSPTNMNSWYSTILQIQSQFRSEYHLDYHRHLEAHPYHEQQKHPSRC